MSLLLKWHPLEFLIQKEVGFIELRRFEKDSDERRDLLTKQEGVEFQQELWAFLPRPRQFDGELACLPRQETGDELSEGNSAWQRRKRANGLRLYRRPKMRPEPTQLLKY